MMTPDAGFFIRKKIFMISNIILVKLDRMTQTACNVIGLVPAFFMMTFNAGNFVTILMRKMRKNYLPSAIIDENPHRRFPVAGSAQIA